jgi:energy-coupling factor transport system permease protein
MIRDITIGQYYQADSPIHALDPRTKILGTFLYIIGIFMADTLWGLFIATFCIAVVIRCSQVPFRFMARGLKSILWILLFTTVLNLFMETGTPLVSFWVLTITWEGLRNALLVASRLILLILGSSMMTLTSTPLQLSSGLERLMRPLKKIKVPVHDISMMISIALRFIPVLLEETDRIMKAQKARGADFENGTIKEKIQSLIPIFVPLLLSLFRRAEELALAMESRCYRGDIGRTQMNELHYAKADYRAFGLMLLFLLLMLGTKFLPGLFTLIGPWIGVAL